MTGWIVSAMKKSLGCAAALSLMAGAAQAAICSLTNAGDQCVINWDASGLGTGPFDATNGGIGGDGLPPVTWSWFDGLDATGALFVSGGPANALDLFGALPGSTASLWDDGRASLLIALTVNSAAVIHNFSLRFTDSSGVPHLVSGTVGSLSTVPTPDSLSLLAIALLGAGAATGRRWRRPAPLAA